MIDSLACCSPTASKNQVATSDKNGNTKRMGNHQLVCKTRPACRCSDAADECCCRIVYSGAMSCEECGARLVWIDIDTGALFSEFPVRDGNVRDYRLGPPAYEPPEITPIGNAIEQLAELCAGECDAE